MAMVWVWVAEKTHVRMIYPCQGTSLITTLNSIVSSQCPPPFSMLWLSLIPPPPILFPEHLYKTMLRLTAPGQEGGLFYISSTELPVRRAASLTSCWAVVPSSNNDSYLKENTDGKNKKNRQLIPFILGVASLRVSWQGSDDLRSRITQFSHRTTWLVSDLFFFFFLMVLGFSFVRRHFALWGGFCNSCLDEVNICKSNHQNFNQLCHLA